MQRQTAELKNENNKWFITQFLSNFRSFQEFKEKFPDSYHGELAQFLSHLSTGIENEEITLSADESQKIINIFIQFVDTCDYKDKNSSAESIITRKMFGFAVKGFHFDKQNRDRYQVLINHIYEKYYNSVAHDHSTIQVSIEKELIHLLNKIRQAIHADDSQALSTTLNGLKEYGLTFQQLLTIDLSQSKNGSFYEIPYNKSNIKTLMFLVENNISITYPFGYSVLDHFEKIKKISRQDSFTYTYYLGKAMLALLLQLQHKRMDETSLRQAEKEKAKIISIIVSDHQKDILKDAIVNYVNAMIIVNEPLNDQIKTKEKQIAFLDEMVLKKATWINDVFNTRIGFGKSQNLKDIETLSASLKIDLENLKKQAIEVNTKIADATHPDAKEKLSEVKQNPRQVAYQSKLLATPLLVLADKSQQAIKLKAILDGIKDHEIFSHFINALSELGIKLTIESFEALIQHPLTIENFAIVKEFISTQASDETVKNSLYALENKLAQLKALLSILNKSNSTDDANAVQVSLDLMYRKRQMTWKQVKEIFRDTQPTVFTTSLRTLPILYKQGLLFKYDHSQPHTEGLVLKHFRYIGYPVQSSHPGHVDGDMWRKGTALLILLLQLNHNNIDKLAFDEAVKDQQIIIQTIRTEENKKAFLIGLEDWLETMVLSPEEETKDVDQNEVLLLKKKIAFIDDILIEKSWTHAFITDFGKTNGKTIQKIQLLKETLEKQLKKSTAFDHQLKALSTFTTVAYLKTLVSNFNRTHLSLPMGSKRVVDITVDPSLLKEIGISFLSKDVYNNVSVGYTKNSVDGRLMICQQTDDRVGLVERPFSKNESEQTLPFDQSSSISFLMLVFFCQREILAMFDKETADRLEIPCEIDFLGKPYEKEKRIKILESIRSINEVLEKLHAKKTIEEHIQQDNEIVFNQFLNDHYTHTTISHVLRYVEVVDKFSLPKNKVKEQEIKGKAVLNMLLHLDNNKFQVASVDEKLLIIKAIRQFAKAALKQAIKDKTYGVVLLQNMTADDQTIAFIKMQINFLEEKVLKQGTWVYAALSRNDENLNGTTFREINDFYQTLKKHLVTLENLRKKPEAKVSKAGVFSASQLLITNVKTLPMLYHQGVTFDYYAEGVSDGKNNCVLRHFKNISEFKLNLPNSSSTEEKMKGTAILVLLLQLNKGNLDERSFEEAIMDQENIIDSIRTDKNKKAFLVGLNAWVDTIQLSPEEKTNDDNQDIINLLEKKIAFVQGILNENCWTYMYITHSLKHENGDTIHAVRALENKLKVNLGYYQNTTPKLTWGIWDKSSEKLAKDNKITSKRESRL